MRIGPWDSDEKVLVVAEIGNNHEGDAARAERMVALAAEAGADAVKFQTFRTELFVSPVDADRFHRLKSFELTPTQFERLARAARAHGLLFLSTPLDLESARFLDGIVDAFKVASGDNTFGPLLEAVAATGKPVILSTGLLDLAGVRRAKAVVEEVWHRRGIRQELALLHCVCSYPVPPEQANLGAIAHMRREIGGVIGYSDHTIGIEAAALAAALGARVIEKHFTFDKNASDFRDHKLSADPEDLRELVRRVREARAVAGDGVKVPQPCERALETAVRRSVAAARDLPAGRALAREDLIWTRPGGGVPPGEEYRLLGHALARPVRRGVAIRPEDAGT